MEVQTDLVEFTTQVEREVIDDIMVTALEGGINYWCRQVVVEPVPNVEYASDALSQGHTLRLFDAEEDKVYELTLEKFMRGLMLWIQDHYVFDANDADTIVQLALFGEVVYG